MGPSILFAEVLKVVRVCYVVLIANPTIRQFSVLHGQLLEGTICFDTRDGCFISSTARENVYMMKVNANMRYIGE